MGSSQSIRAEVRGYKDTYAEFSGDKPCLEGNFRRAYQGTFHGADHMEGKKCVVKVYKKHHFKQMDEFAWEADKRAHEKANEMARVFNHTYGTSKPIEFVKPEFADIDAHAASDLLGYNPYESSKIIPKTVTVTVERYLEGTYETFINNFGCVHNKPMATPAAFSHFTYHKSDGQVLVCDLQGVRTATSYKFTDPAVHSSGPKAQMYGRTDLGKLGIVVFFARHKCNVLCEGLTKPKGVRNCTTGELVDFDTIASTLGGEGSVMDTFEFSDLPGFDAILREISKTDFSIHTNQLGIGITQIQEIQAKVKLET